MEDEIAELKRVVAGITETLAKQAASLSTVDPPLLHSTPVSSHTLQEGRNANSFTLDNNGSSQRQCAADEGSFSLLLTNIDSSVEETDVYRMVVQALGILRILNTSTL